MQKKAAYVGLQNKSLHFRPRHTPNSRLRCCATQTTAVLYPNLSSVLYAVHMSPYVEPGTLVYPSVCPHLCDPPIATEVSDRFASNSACAFFRKRCPAVVSFVKIGSDGLALFSDVSKCVPILSVFLCGSGRTSVHETCQQSGRALLSFLKLGWGKDFTFLTDVNENPTGRA